MELIGVEPITSALQGRRSSQLSYSPKIINNSGVHTQIVGLSRIELLTSRLSGVRSNHLSYRPIFLKPLAQDIKQKFKNELKLKLSEQKKISS